MSPPGFVLFNAGVFAVVKADSATFFFNFPLKTALLFFRFSGVRVPSLGVSFLFLYFSLTSFSRLFSRSEFFSQASVFTTIAPPCTLFPFCRIFGFFLYVSIVVAGRGAWSYDPPSVIRLSFQKGGWCAVIF